MRKACLFLCLLLLTALCGCGTSSVAGPRASAAATELPPPPTPTPLLSPPPPSAAPTPEERAAEENAGVSGLRTEKRLPLGLQQAPEDVYPALAAEAAAPRVCTVQPGDCLWTIAEAFCGDGAAWRQIWAENRESIPDPGLVYAGQELRLP